MNISSVKYGVKEFQRNIYFNIFIILQIAAALILIVYCVSSIEYISKFYLPLEEHMDSEGLCSNTAVSRLTLEELERLDFVDEVYYCGAMTCFIVDDAYYAGDHKEVDINIYDEDLIGDYRPLLEYGVWLDECGGGGDALNAVISYTDEYEIGDRITLVSDPDTDIEKEYEFKIVGMLCDGAKVLDCYETMSEVTDAASLYPNYYSSQHKNEFLLLTESDDVLTEKSYIDMSLIKYEDGHSEEEYEEFDMQLGAEFEIDGIKLSKIREASLKQIREQMVMTLPLIIGISVLLLVSVLSMSAISSNKQLRNYGTYCICGAAKSDCVFIQICSILCCCTISICLACAFFNILKLSGKLNGSIFAFGTNELLACAALITLTIIASSLMPAIIIGNRTKKDMLREMDL